jgi:hypothetical protein
MVMANAPPAGGKIDRKPVFAQPEHGLILAVGILRRYSKLAISRRGSRAWLHDLGPPRAVTMWNSVFGPLSQMPPASMPSGLSAPAITAQLASSTSQKMYAWPSQTRGAVLQDHQWMVEALYS